MVTAWSRVQATETDDLLPRAYLPCSEQCRNLNHCVGASLFLRGMVPYYLDIPAHSEHDDRKPHVPVQSRITMTVSNYG